MRSAVPHDLRPLRALSLEAARRPLRRRPLEVIDYHSRSPHPEEHLALLGSISVLAARPGNSFMKEIRRAVADQDEPHTELAKRLYRQYAKRETVSIERAAAIALDQPVFADLHYGGTTLVENVFVPEDLDVALITLPYNGGRLAAGGFSLVEHPRTDDAASLDVLVLRNTPPKTKAEAAALSKVPSEQRALNVGRGPGDVACSVLLLVAAVAVEAAVVAVTFAITGKVDVEHIEHIDPGTILELGPAATARQMVELRRQALQGDIQAAGPQQ